MKKLLKCGKLFSAVDGTVKENIAVIINDNKIENILDLESIEDDSSYEVVNLSDKFVMPGLIDTHVHFMMNGKPTYSYGEMYSTLMSTFALRGLIYVRDDLMAGFTTLRDCCAPGFSDVALRDAINNGFHWGPRMFVSGLPINALGGHGDSIFNMELGIEKVDNIRAIVCGPDEARNAARRNFKYGADQIKFFSTYGVLSYGDEPGPQELTYEEMRAIIEVAEFRGKITATHAHGNAGIRTAVKAGVTSIEHGSFLDDEIIELMNIKGTYLVPTLMAEHRILENVDKGLIAPYAIKKAKICSDAHKESFKKALKQGVKIAFGTDAASPYNKHGEQAFEFSLMVNLGMSPTQALLSATKVAAELLRWDDKIGTLEEGKYADIIALSENPLNDIGAMMNVEFVMKDGVIYKNKLVN